MRAACIALAVAALALPGSGASAGAGASGYVWGVTLDNDAGIRTHALEEQVASLAALPLRPTAQVVLDLGTSPSDYAPALRALHRVAGTVAMLGDSSEVRGVSPAVYRRWVVRMVSSLSPWVDTWEVGNEANGEWTGAIARQTRRIAAAYDAVRARGGRTSIVLAYNSRCGPPPANELFRWLDGGALPARVAAGLDDVWLSYYPGDCHGDWPAPAVWQRVFARLHARFPHARVGFGESGLSHPARDQRAAVRLLDRYVAVRPRGVGYVGGLFWWYFAEDGVPEGTTFWHGYAAAQRRAG